MFVLRSALLGILYSLILGAASLPSIEVSPTYVTSWSIQRLRHGSNRSQLRELVKYSSELGMRRQDQER